MSSQPQDSLPTISDATTPARRVFLTHLGAMAGATALTACGGGGGGGGNDIIANTPAPTTAPTPTPTPGPTPAPTTTPAPTSPPATPAPTPAPTTTPAPTSPPGSTPAPTSTPRPTPAPTTTPAPTSPPATPAPTPTPTPTPAPTTTPTPTPGPAPAPSGARQFTLSSPTAGTWPFSLGFAFKKGDIPTGSYAVAASLPQSQVRVKNRWPDGSVKFAIVSGRATLTAGTALTVVLSSTTTAPTGTALTTTALRATAVTATVTAGAYGTVDWRDGDWDTPFQSWVAGPEMSSWIYRKPVGTDKHLVVWLEVRLFADGAVEVLPWIENGYLRVTGPTSKSATFTFSLGGSQRFSAAIDLPSQTRTPLLSGAALSHWLLSTTPQVMARHDTAYLQATRLVPTYSAVVAPTAGRVLALPATFTPLQLGNFDQTMGAAGYQPAIGLLPEWDVLYLTSTASATWAGVQRNGYSAGRWESHYRDETTNRPLRFSQYPTLLVYNNTGGSTANNYTPTPSGTGAPEWDIPHHPSVGYMAYLVTGRFYFMEEVLFAATRNFLYQPDATRQTTLGIFRTNSGAATFRGTAWSMRTLAQATTVLPDDDPVRPDFITSLEANINFNHTRYVAQANNPFGIVETYGDNSTGTDGRWTTATWQMDFHTAAYGYMLAMDPPVSAAIKTKLAAFFTWTAQSIVGRLGGTGTNEWLYRDAAVYTFTLALNDNPDWATGTGPWPASWGVMYNATFDGATDSNPSPGPRVAGDLRGGNFPNSTSYWGNLQPAISYAVEHGITGAAAAYARMTGASNWSQFSTGMNTDPVWSVRPSVFP